MPVLMVAEKPSVAEAIARGLSPQAQLLPARRNGFKTWQLTAPFRGRGNETFFVTAVAGHLVGLDFPAAYRKWASVPPVQLFDAPTVRTIDESKQNIADNLKHFGRSARELVIWTDCDREGEAIGQEIVDTVREVNQNVTVYRARFSVLQPHAIKNAMNTLGAMNRGLVEAVEARSELDLRIGAAFTRMLTMRLRGFGELEGKLVSYGSCQFPTLGFVVDQYRRIQEFQAEDFWKLELSLRKENQKVDFLWARNHLFDQRLCAILYEKCMENPVALISSVISKPTFKYKPLPLTTIELTKQGSRILRMSGDRIMKVAEDLYQKGFISYPRTETNVFEPDFVLEPLIEAQRNDPRWGQYAQRLLGGAFRRPRAGRDNDKAHPPIHPVKDGSTLNGDDARIYEFVTRRFLGCCSDDARGTETVIKAEIADEVFTAKGLIVRERNYLEVYTYDRWSDNEIPNFVQGERLACDTFVMKQGTTQAPPLLSEADLITLMEKSGIGTDATIHDHIKTIQDRDYVIKDGNGRFTPTTLGYALIQGFDSMGFGFNVSLSKPYLRRKMETDMKGICDGVKGVQEVVRDNVVMYRDVFVKAQQQLVKIEQSVAELFGHGPDRQVGEDPGDLQPVRNCPKCGSLMVLRKSKDGRLYIGCTGYPACKESLWIPDNTTSSVEAMPDECNRCGSKLLRIKFIRGKVPPDLDGVHETCLFCNGQIRAFFDEIRPARRPGGGLTQSQQQQPAQQAQRGAPRAQFVAPAEDRFRGADHGPAPGYGQQRDPGPRRPPATRHSNSDPDQENQPMCQCNLPAIMRTAGESSKNPGRQFWTCSQPRDSQCQFFQWTDATPSDDAPRRSQYHNDSSAYDGPRASQPLNLGPASYRSNQRHRGGDEDEVEPPRCNCDLIASVKTVHKEGENKDRQFYSCGKTGSRCNFFQWVHETPDETAKRERGGNFGGGGGGANFGGGRGGGGRTGATGSCFKCGQEGHWSNACPAPNGGGGGGGGRRGRGRGGSTRSRGRGRGRGRSRATYDDD